MSGCIYDNPSITNFDPMANTDQDVGPFGTLCDFDFGNRMVNEVCIDPEALNYFIFADPTSSGFTQNVADLVTVNALSCFYPPVIAGCMDALAFNYNAQANLDNGTCEAVLRGCMNPLYLDFNEDANTEITCNILIVEGCTDISFTEYSSAASLDDGTCIIYKEYGCTDSAFLEYNQYANVLHQSSCAIITVYGCTNINYIEYIN